MQRGLSEKDVSIAGDQFAFVGRNMGERPEAIDLQSIDIFVRVKRFGDGGKAAWEKSGKA